ncbi:MAG: TRAP transporter substrate-binding protein [Alphaproteobacteria bacterium]|nr:TRAP transporter substrate-binding protein [Alphaproteobacteria bacterium]
MLLAGLAAATLASADPAFAQTKWNLPAAYPTDNFHSENLVAFAKDVEAATGGKMVITVHANASLFKAPEIKRAVLTGQAQMGEVLMSIHENEDPLFGIDVVPFLATSFADSAKLWAAAKQQIVQKLDAQGLLLLYSVPWPPQGVYSKKELKTLADMKGQKWRAYNAGTARIGEAVGAQAVTIQAAELAQAAATGAVDIFISSGATGYDIKAWESLKYFYDTNAWLPRNIIFVNKGMFEALDKPTQEAIRKSAAAAEDRGNKISQEKSAWYLEEFKKRGMTVSAPSPELAAGYKQIGDQLTADWIKKAGAPGQAVIDAYKKM